MPPRRTAESPGASQLGAAAVVRWCSPVPARRAMASRTRDWGLTVGEEQANRRALSECATRFNASPVGFDEVLHDRKAQARPPLFPRSARFDAIEALENAGQMLRGNTAPGVGHRY